MATDRKPARELEAEALKLEEDGVRLELGEHRQGTFTGASLIVVSPGVPWKLPELEAARRAGVPVIAELELGYRQITGTVAAVTGTKGKSTTTAALGAMLREAGEDARVGGNIGQAITGLLEGASKDTIFVLEVSSFQLEGSEAFHPKLALFLNLSADHLDRHPSFEDYRDAKARIFRNQTADDWAVVNADDAPVLALARASNARLCLFSAARGPSPNPLPGSETGPVAFFENGEARLRREGRSETLFTLASVRLPGSHLAGDLLAAAAAARLLGASPEAIARAVARFHGVEHVLERVAEIGGVEFFNDSKATNIDAAQKSLEAFDGRCWRSSAAATRAATSRRSRRWSSATPRRSLPSARPASGSWRRSRRRPRWCGATTCTRPWCAPTPRPSLATPCCSAPAAPPSTCSATTRTAAAPSSARS